MLLVAFLANGLMQNIVSPFAYGAALEVSPLVLPLTVLLGRYARRRCRNGAGRSRNGGRGGHRTNAAGVTATAARRGWRPRHAVRYVRHMDTLVASFPGYGGYPNDNRPLQPLGSRTVERRAD